ncbi:MAG: AAA family ATPase [Planctomycetes bacterium]|nr:AAA family ATPase [Planctomycetota bacterium]MCB9920424.1 AAA family ATPase [Planctomycetota bacterium]
MSPTENARQGGAREESATRIAEASSFLREVVTEVERVLVGQRELLDGLLIGLLADGHVLLEGVPGLAKSLAVEALAGALGGTFRRIQFTPDLLPSDLLGTQVYNPKSGDWSLREGPVFGNFILADEINRAPAKVQSALLEAMQERQVTLAGETRRLPEPFLVLATQNPVEQEGTYTLPEAQVDRFMLKIVVGYPTREEEDLIVTRMATLGKKPRAKAVASPAQVLGARALLDDVYVDELARRYVLDLVFATRDPKAVGLDEIAPLILYGASPRASIAMTLAARAHAFLEGRAYVSPSDIQAVGLAVLRHRVIPTFEAEAKAITSDDIVRRIFEAVAIP